MWDALREMFFNDKNVPQFIILFPVMPQQKQNNGRNSWWQNFYQNLPLLITQLCLLVVKAPVFAVSLGPVDEEDDWWRT
ncbi:hypothetical protein AAHA92_16393 [Salvia divinorum]|uniref:Uncharacterized protein n=1 Tax=Salvia divinorum TaxID=28513 RepID=A0ABD1GYC7_SALDI